MRVRDSFATLNGDCSTVDIPSGGLDIVSMDGRALFSLRLEADGTLHVSGGNFCNHAGIMLDETLSIFPRACNLVYIRKNVYTAAP